MAMSENMIQGGPAPTLPKNLEVPASMMQGGPAPALPPEMIAAIRELIEMGMSPSEAIDQMTKRVDPSAFGGKRMGALPPPMPPVQQMPQSQPPMSQNDMAQYLANKVAETKMRMSGGQMGALPPPMPRMASQTPPPMPPQMQGMRK